MDSGHEGYGLPPLHCLDDRFAFFEACNGFGRGRLAECYFRFERRRSDTALSENQAAQRIARIDNILTQLPEAIRQAHERIIGGRPFPNEEKILSLYDPDIDVIVRGKAGAEVEFGSKLWLGELDSGLIVDYILLKENQADTALIGPALERLKTQTELKAGLKTAFADRGIHSAANEKLLEDEGITSGLCPPTASPRPAPP